MIRRSLALLVALAGASVLPERSHAQAALVSLRGVAYDSLRSAPLSGAVVVLLGPARRTTTDTEGRFVFDSVAPGVYTLVMQHDSLESVGFSGITARATITAAPADVRLFLPSFLSLWRAACPAGDPDAGSGLLYGSIRDAITRDPLGGANVALTWVEILADSTRGFFQRRYTGRARSDETGSYALCGVQLTEGSRLQATIDSTASGLIDLPATSLRIQRRDLLVARASNRDSIARGTIIGVLTREAGGPFPGARVVMDEAPEARSGANGRFLIRDVPAGTRQLEVLALGMRPVVTAVDVVANDTVTVAMTLHPITTLEAMRVTASARQMHIQTGIEQRRKSGLGYMKDSTQLWGTMSGVFDSFLGLQTYRGEGGRFSVAARNSRGGYCQAYLYVDGRWQRDQEELHWLRTDDIATVEVYPRPSMTPAEFVPPAAEPCGAVVIWTKHTFR